MEVGKSTLLRIGVQVWSELVSSRVRKCSLSLDPPIPFMFESKGICDDPCDREEEGIVVSRKPQWWEGLLYP